jgi:SEC-C motif
VGGSKELIERLGRNDPCPCESGRRFQEVLHARRRLRRPTTTAAVKSWPVSGFAVHSVTAGSTGRRNELGESFGWGLPVESLAWSAVELHGNAVEFVLGDVAEAGAFGEVLA